MKNLNLGKLLFEDENQNQLVNYIQSEISDSSLKTKISSVMSTLKISNIPKADQLEFQIFTQTKNNFVDNLLDIIIILLKKIRDVSDMRDSLKQEIEKEKIKYEELDKKCKKLVGELSEVKKEYREYTNKNFNEKEKTESNKKSINNECAELRQINKKLNNMLFNYKNEMKKKETEYNKIQDKIRRVLGDKNNYSDIELSSYLCETDPIEIINHASSYTSKYESIILQNETVFATLRNINQIITSIVKKINDLNYDVDFMEIIGINENLFSIHLIEDDLQTFYNNFKYNSKIFERIIIDLIDGKLEKKKPANDSDILKNFKRWSLSNIEIDEKPKKKWYENMNNYKKIKFEDQS